MGVPPGSAVSSTGKCFPRSRLPRIRSWVDLPLPSGPSKVINRPRLIAASLVIDEIQNLLQVVPRLALGVLIIGTEQIRGVVRHHHRNVMPLVPVSAQAGHSVFGREQRFGSG